MDQKRLLVAIALSVAILLVFQVLLPSPKPPVVTTQNTPSTLTPPPTGNPAAPGTQPTANVPPPEMQRDTPRLRIVAPSVEGSINLAGARLDDLVLRDYRVDVAPQSPLVRLLEPRYDPQPYYVQFGWTADGDVKVPGPDTLWTASASELTQQTPVTLSWDNGAGQVFEIALSVDDAYLFRAEQRVRNSGSAPVRTFAWSRIRRDYTPQVAGYYILHEGLLGVVGGRLQEQTYSHAKEAGPKEAGGASLSLPTTGGWLGITDKYWLTALIPDQRVPVQTAFRYINENGRDRYQVDFVTKDALAAEAGGLSTSVSHLFAGAKEVSVLDRYESQLGLPYFDKAVDFGWFYPFTKWIFYALDWLFKLTGNFGIAIMIFTVFVKLLFFPLANKSYRSMNKMKLLGPKVQEIRERLKDEPQKVQAEIMAVYKASGVNPVSGCLPMLIQIPVFFSLYKVIFVTIEMRHAPFFGWIKDLSAVDPTNVFNLFGLLPFDPAQYSHLLHLGIWPIIMGITMYLQQKLNPPPPDPVQARIFQFMPIIFTFMLASFPAGLVIYWSWNNLLTIAQQWTIMRRAGPLTTTAPARP